MSFFIVILIRSTRLGTSHLKRNILNFGLPNFGLRMQIWITYNFSKIFENTCERVHFQVKLQAEGNFTKK